MVKIRNIHFVNHPILGNLQLNFCNERGEACDTIILAGENGSGKSSILNEIYSVFTRKVDDGKELSLVIEDDERIRHFTYHWEKSIGDNNILYVILDGKKYHIHDPHFAAEFNPFVIFSDVDIQFRSRLIPSVTGISLDELAASRKSPDDLSTEINQLLVDIQAMDDATIASAIREDPEKSFSEIDVDVRMSRFTDAFSEMLEDLKYSKIVNKNGYKRILFKRTDTEIPIEALSSGEKQIVYRGAFLLKDLNALKNAFVLIDEPEISLHPKWQKKILNYYKKIFTDKDGTQTSQLIVALQSITESLFFKGSPL